MKDISRLGIQIKNGSVTLNGKPYRGVGVNFFPALSLCLDRVVFGDTRTDVEDYIKKLSESDIPCMRVMFGVYYGEYVCLWADKEKRTRYHEACDLLISLAEKYRIGIIASLFWNVNAFCDYVGDPLDLIADPQSRSTKLRIEYVRDIVNRYKHSPAIWAWEIGNELNLACEMTDTEFTTSKGERTLFRTEYLTEYYRIIGRAIREYDPYRMLTGGDAAPRTNSMALFRSSGKVTEPENTRGDNREVLGWYTPAPLDTVSVHYPELRLMKEYSELARELNIALYVGEFHGKLFDNPLDAISPEENPKEKRERDSWNETLDTYISCDIGLVTQWCYGSYSQGKNIDPASLELGADGGIVQNLYIRDGINRVNSYFRESGMADTAAYWQENL